MGTLELESECLWEVVSLQSRRREKSPDGSDGDFRSGYGGLGYDSALGHVL